MQAGSSGKDVANVENSRFQDNADFDDPPHKPVCFMSSSDKNSVVRLDVTEVRSLHALRKEDSIEEFY